MKGVIAVCTAAGYKTKGFYFGRTLDYEFSYGERVAISPRGFRFRRIYGSDITHHYAIAGMAHVADGFPLYYDAMNEKGLCMAGLNFVGNAVYRKPLKGAENLAQFEFIPYILSRCESVGEARELLKRINITDTLFGDEFPLAELHWIIADKDGAVTVESVRDGLMVYDNPVCVLTNNPPFPEQLDGLNKYMGLSAKEPENRFSKSLPLRAESRGMGAIGLPGDLSSRSRFVRAAFVKENSVSGAEESESVSQFFHILGAVEQPKGCCELAGGEYEITIYTSCCSADSGIYYYTTYGNRQISAVDMSREDLDGCALIEYPLVGGERIYWQN